MRAAIGERIRWQRSHWLLAGTLVAISVVLTGNAWLETAKLGFKDEEVGYVLMAPFLVGCLAWVRRSRLQYCRPGGGWMGNLVALGGWFCWSYGYRKSVPTLWHGGCVLIAAGVFLAVVGKDILWKFLPAFAALIFLIPVTPTRRQIIAGPLEAYAAQWTQAGCELLGLHIARAGNLLSVNGANVEVAEACNGMRMIITFWLLCFMFAFTQPLRWYARVGILIVVPIVAIAMNVIRLIPTVWMYSYGAGETAQRFHDVAGWAMLFVTVSFLYGVIAALRWAMVPIRHYQTLTG